MRLLADENFPAASVRALRAEGHDVAAVGETQSGADDSTVLQIAREQQRVLITFDRDFGVLVFGDGIAAPRGVVFLRFQPVGPEEPARVMLACKRRPGSAQFQRFGRGSAAAIDWVDPLLRGRRLPS